ncbi:hypothetical protein CTAYLR_009213 [Chrysophaeum taylorii]|uniref:Ion transport domain-containing protein n=1 Tax=Chrysophaeum taylorii TaxID=2483200 RepID=A0AAD7U942_9STRA|nr:hypothetical protein CTAYLR_009213 [Chrysophaeum taylorii]
MEAEARYQETPATNNSTASNVPRERVEYLWNLARSTKTLVKLARTFNAYRQVHVDETTTLDASELEPKKMPPRTPKAAKQMVDRKRRSALKENNGALDFPKSSWMINPDGRFYWVWAGLMLPAMAYASLVTPYETAFVSKPCALLFPNLIVDTYFVMDVFVNFNIGKFDWQAARWITSRTVIVKGYLKGWFTVDLLSCLPFDIIVASRGSFLAGIKLAFGCTGATGSELKMLSMLKLFRLLKLLRVLRIGRLVMRFAASVNISFKTQTIVKFAVVIMAVTHLFACLIRIVGDTEGCRRTFRKSPDDPACWLTSIRFFRKGIWYQYIASLDWAIKAMIGGSASLTFGEMLLGFIFMLAGLVLTSYLVGEIANVLGNFDPALNDFRSTMDNLNQYLKDQKINNRLQVQLREYFINSEGLFRKAYHKSMLENLSPQLRRNVAQAELGRWVLSLPFLNDALRTCGGLEPGADIMFLTKEKLEAENGWSESDLVPAQITEVHQSLTYSVRYYNLHAIRRQTNIHHSKKRMTFRSVARNYARTHWDEQALALKSQTEEGDHQQPLTTTKAPSLARSPKPPSIFGHDRARADNLLDANSRIKSFKGLQREIQRNPHLYDCELVEEDRVAHDQIFMPEFSLLRGRLAEANREWRHLVAEFSLALTPKMFMMNEHIIRPGSLNTHLYMLMEGHGYVSDYCPTQSGKMGTDGQLSRWRAGEGAKSARSSDEIPSKSAWTFNRYLTAKNYDVVGVDIINTLVGAPMIVPITATAVGHVFCNVLTSQQLNDIMTFDVYPKLTAEVRKMAGWRLFKRGVVRLGSLAAQERRARFQYCQARRVLQRLWFYSKRIEKLREPVLPWSEDYVSSDRITKIVECADLEDEESCCAEPRRRVFRVGDHVEAVFCGKNYRLKRPAIVTGVHSKLRHHDPTSYMVRFTAKTQRILHAEREGASVQVVNRSATMAKILDQGKIEDGILVHFNSFSLLGTVYLKETTQVVDPEDVEPCHKLNSRVKVQHHRQVLDGRICCLYTDGTYSIIYDYHECRASVLTWLFWRTNKYRRWLWPFPKRRLSRERDVSTSAAIMKIEAKFDARVNSLNCQLETLHNKVDNMVQLMMRMRLRNESPSFGDAATPEPRTSLRRA